MRPDGLKHILDEMLVKYQDGPIKIEPDDILMDIGANVGEFSRAAAGEGARVFSIEPDPNAFRCLAFNAPQATPLAVAVGDEDGFAEIFLSTAGADSSFVNPTSESALVKGRTVNTLMKELGLDRIDFLKIEAEGFEPEVLAGAVPVLDRIRKIAIDCGPERHGKHTFEQCEAILDNFRTWRRDNTLFALVSQ